MNHDVSKPRYLLFGYDDYYPGGGMSDLIGQFDTMEELLAAKKEALYCDNYTIEKVENNHLTQLDDETGTEEA